MKVQVRLFAIHRERMGQGLLELELEPGATVADLLVSLKARWPQLQPLGEGVMIAVNAEYVGPDFRLKDGDEVALIPPVSGGSQGFTPDP